jgi:ketosteroid isomerase-like protein
MKTCPLCKNNYTDNSLAFCLQDGTPLLEIMDEAETVISARNPMPTISQPNAFATSPMVEEPAKSKTWMVVLATILVTLLLFGGIGIAIAVFMRGNMPPIVENTNTNISKPNVNVATPTPTATPTPKPTIKPSEVSAIKSDLENAVEDWKSAIEAFDVDANLASYADSVDYYKGGKVSRAKIKQDKEKALTVYDTINITLKDVEITPDPSGERATATFNKEWDFENSDKRNRGEVKQQLIFAKISGKWKIISEKDLKVLWTDKGDSNSEANASDIDEK